MALILGLDTSTKAISLAIFREGSSLDHIYQVSEDYRHAEQLHVAIDILLKRNGLQPTDIDALLLGNGPGSYTGLRIGASAAKGMAYALDIPIITCSTLKIMASQALRNAKIHKGCLMPMLDARRMEVYMAIYDDTLQEVAPISPQIIDEGWRPPPTPSPIYAFGDGMPKCRTLLSNIEDLRFIEDIGPDVSSMGEYAEQAYAKGDFVDTAYFEPGYLKEFQAGKPKKLL